MEEIGQESGGVNWQVVGRQHNVINSVVMGIQARIVYIQCDEYIKILLQYSFSSLSDSCKLNKYCIISAMS